MSAENAEYLGEQLTDEAVVVKRRVSIVWRYFEKLDRFRVRCKLCRHEQNYQGTTGNILRHLKNKHNIDATLKGQKDSPGKTQKVESLEVQTEQEFATEEDEFQEITVKTEESTVNITRAPQHVKNKVSSYCVEDPYGDTSILENYIESSTYEHEVTDKKSTQNSAMRKNTAEEERVLAEIEYFREKAAYYRMQKNLAALQAKKVKYELEHLG